MNKKIALMMKAFAEMNSTEQGEFITEIGKYIESSDNQKGIIKEGYTKKALAMDLGPLNSGACPVCGRR